MVGQIRKINYVSTFVYSGNTYANSQVDLESSGSILFLRCVGFPWNDPQNILWKMYFLKAANSLSVCGHVNKLRLVTISNLYAR
jgi:hypothetical protein